MTDPSLAPRPAALDVADPAFAAAQAPLKLLLFDFDGVFTDNAVWVFEDGREAIRANRSDGIGLRRVERAGVACAIISTEVNKVVAARAKKLEIECRHGQKDKVAAARELAAARGIGLDACGFVGNDVNDIPLLKAVGLPLGVADAYRDIWPFVRWLTTINGGHGAVREICDAIAAARGVPARFP